MNINKINTQLQYWHDVNELPKKYKLILFKAKFNDSYYFIGAFNNIDYVYQFCTYGLNDAVYKNPLENSMLNRIYKHQHNNWYNVVEKWMYLTDLKELIE